MLDLSKLADAVTKVASLAQSHAYLKDDHSDVSAALAKAVADNDALRGEMTSAQADIDHIVNQLLAATTSPAEAVGITAVAAALAAPAPTPDALATPAEAPVAPVAPLADPVPHVVEDARGHPALPPVAFGVDPRLHT